MKIQFQLWILSGNMKRTMKIGFIRELKTSRGRFISIMLLMFISTFTLIGLKFVGPDIRQTANEYLDEYNLADLTITGSYGLSEEEVKLLNEEVSGGEIEYGYFTDVTIGDKSDSMRIYSSPDEISKYELVEGEMPGSDNEIAISNQMASEYPLGSEIELVEKASDSDDLLKTHTFTVVGYVNSLEIMSTMDLGATNVGTGQLNGYGVVTPETFNSEVYMIARITYDDLRNKDAFMDEYLTAVAEHKTELEDALETMPSTRIETIKADAYTEISENEQKLKDAESELDDAEVKLEDAKSELDNAKEELTSAQAEIDSGNAEISAAQTQLNDAVLELEEKQSLVDNKTNELNDAKQEIDASLDDLEQAQSQIDDNKAQLDASKAQLEDGKNQYELKIDELNEQITSTNQALNQEGLSDAQIATLKQTLEQLNAGLEEATTSYNDFIQNAYNPGIAEINEGYAQISDAQSEVDQGYSEITPANDQVNAGLLELASAQSQIDTAYEKVSAGFTELETNKQKLVDGQAELDQGKIEYEAGLKEYETNKAKFDKEEPDARADIEEGYIEIEEAKADLASLKRPVYQVSTRSETSTAGGYQVFTSLATSIDKVANVFPILLYAVAALVTFTTMTRYVEDERINTGTLLSLGYSEKEIVSKFVVYGAVASSVGAILGIILGSVVIPLLLYTAFRGEFTTPDLIFTFDISVAFIALVVSLLCAIIPAFLVSSSEFKHAPSSLLLPKPPSDGSKILLERIPAIWNRLSFAHKVTARNIFRYKKRMFMTIFGVSGSVALLFTGLAMQGSIGNISDLQFKQIINYDMIVISQDNLAIDKEQKINDYLNQSQFEATKDIYVENVSQTAGPNNERQTITMMVADEFDNYINFIDRKSKEELTLKDDEVLISERLASILGLQIGDSFVVNSAEDEEITLTVGGITEMYMGHFIYMNKTTYENAFNTSYSSNASLVKMTNNDLDAVQEEVINIMKLDGVNTVMQNQSLINQVNNMSASLNSVMKLLIVLSVMLAVVILYNITNINVNERMRELSTTKVLGYYDNEVTLYIYRETVILSLIGIGVGYILGRIIHLFMMVSVAPLNMMFDPQVVISAFIVPAVLIILVSIILGIIVHNRLKHVDMLEALKSVE